MEEISAGLAVNKMPLPVERPEDASGNQSDSEATITSDLALAAPAALAVSRDSETEWRGETTFPEVLPPYWMCEKGSGEYENLRADFRSAVTLAVNAEEKNNKGDGLQFMRSNPAQFRGFPADDYHKLLRKSCDRSEERLGRLMKFSTITGSDSQREMRWEIIEKLYNAMDYGDRPGMKEIMDGRIKDSINLCLKSLGQDSADSSNKFILDLLRELSTFRPRYRLIALIRLCEIIPEKIKKIPQSDLEDLPARLALNEADTSGALKCLGETTGYVFLPHGIFADWEDIASLSPDVPVDQTLRTYFAEHLRHRVDKIVGDGRDVNLVMREIVLRLAGLDEDTQSAGAKLLREFFKDDLSSMFAASGSRKALGIIGNYCDRAQLEFADFSKEITARLREGGQLDLQDSFKESAQARIKSNREWNFNRDEYHWKIQHNLIKLFHQKDGTEKCAAVMDILESFGEWTDGREKYFALQDFSAILSNIYRVTITEIIGKEAANAWLSENYALSDREFAFAREHLGLGKVDATPEEAGEEFNIPNNSSDNMKWAERFLLSICGLHMNGSGTAFDMPYSFNRLSWQDRADAMQLTVNWAMRPLNNDTFKKLRAMAASGDLRSLMATTVTKRKFAEVKALAGADNLRELMQKHNMVRSS